MKNPHRALVFGLGVALAGLAAATAAHADEWNKETTVTFDQPVEVPGHVLLPGTYVFKLADSDSDRDIVQIFTADQKQLITTVLAIPDYRLRTPDKTEVVFEERAKGAPEAVRAWFYPGENYGWDFVYSKVIVAPTQMASNAPPPAAPAPAPAPRPQAAAPPPPANPPREMALANPAPEPQPAPEAAPEPAPATTPSPQSLPRTASGLPLLVLVGAGLLASGAFSSALAGRRRRV